MIQWLMEDWHIPMYNVWMDSFRDVMHVYVHVEQLRQVEVHFIVMETEQLVTCNGGDIDDK